MSMASNPKGLIHIKHPETTDLCGSRLTRPSPALLILFGLRRIRIKTINFNLNGETRSCTFVFTRLRLISGIPMMPLFLSLWVVVSWEEFVPWYVCKLHESILSASHSSTQSVRQAERTKRVLLVASSSPPITIPRPSTHPHKQCLLCWAAVLFVKRTNWFSDLFDRQCIVPPVMEPQYTHEEIKDDGKFNLNSLSEEQCMRLVVWTTRQFLPLKLPFNRPSIGRSASFEHPPLLLLCN